MAAQRHPSLHLLTVLFQAWLAVAAPNSTWSRTASAGPSPTWSPAASALSACAASMNGQLPSATPADFHFSGNVRRYYVAAEEVEWNYAPTGWDNWLGVPIDLSPRAQPQLTYNTTYLKALYRGYTDSSFSEYSTQPPWIGTQGPILRSEVGDMLEIMFVNRLSKNYASMHSMGLAYNKHNEGGDYPGRLGPHNDTIPLQAAVPPVDVGIPPGNCVVYKWLADDSSGPSSGPASTHSYHSYVDLDIDTNSGLIGPSIVYAKGQMNSTMANYREIPLLYMIYNEQKSFLSGENAAKFNAPPVSSPEFGGVNVNSLWSGNYSIWHPQLVNLYDADRLSSGPSFHSMNGYWFANNPVYEMCENDKVLWYVTAYGSASHVFHMHGNGFTYQGNNAYAIGINDGDGKTLITTAYDVGLWQVICHVNNHHQMGMVSNYIVYKSGSCPLPALGS